MRISPHPAFTFSVPGPVSSGIQFPMFIKQFFRPVAFHQLQQLQMLWRSGCRNRQRNMVRPEDFALRLIAIDFFRPCPAFGRAAIRSSANTSTSRSYVQHHTSPVLIRSIRITPECRRHIPGAFAPAHRLRQRSGSSRNLGIIALQFFVADPG